MTIYVATDQDGKILAYSVSGLYLIDGVVSIGFHDQPGGVCLPCEIRPITVTTTDGIIGKHWQDVDELMLMLRECSIYGTRGNHAFYGNGWDVWEDTCNGSQQAASQLDLHTALTHLTSKEA